MQHVWRIMIVFTPIIVKKIFTLAFHTPHSGNIHIHVCFVDSMIKKCLELKSGRLNGFWFKEGAPICYDIQNTWQDVRGLICINGKM